MSTTTKNYNLIKPAQDDFYNVDDFNTNADLIDEALTDKVDKEAGKGLSTNDYTNEDKTALSNKVDKEAGKGLSTNDFTDADKNRLTNLSETSDVTFKTVTATKIIGAVYA